MKKLIISLVAALAVSPVFAEEKAAPAPTKKSAPKVSEVELAYKKEFAFLEAQKRDLTKRLASLSEKADMEYATEKRALRRLEESVISSNHKVDNYKELLLDAERAAQESVDNADVLENTFLQADATLEKYKLALQNNKDFQEKNKGEKIETVFATADSLLAELVTVRKEAGKFHALDGKQIDGSIVYFGNVARFGVSEQASGMLAPAGEGMFKLWPVESTADAQALDQGQMPATVNLFLFENADKAIEQRKEKTALDIVQSGGTIAWVIVGFGLIVLVLVIMRVVFLKRASVDTEAIIEKVSPAIQAGDIKAAVEQAKQFEGATARVLTATVRNLDRDREHLEDIVSESLLHESEYLDKFGTAILVLAAVSPLMGLLGTVTGMIATFDVITEFGTGDPKMLSGGISEALVTTELGLVVAIPAVLLGNLLSGWAESIKDDMEAVALKVTNLYKAKEDQ